MLLNPREGTIPSFFLCSRYISPKLASFARRMSSLSPTYSGGFLRSRRCTRAWLCCPSGRVWIKYTVRAVASRECASPLFSWPGGGLSRRGVDVAFGALWAPGLGRRAAPTDSGLGQLDSALPFSSRCGSALHSMRSFGASPLKTNCQTAHDAAFRMPSLRGHFMYARECQ
jgi:hypothetical protein